MSPSENTRLMNALSALRKHYPDWRFGQIIANIATWAKGPSSEAVWDVTDTELLAAAEEHLKQKESFSNPAKIAG